ncbi:hypothetical protein PMAYCL1PPCAC_24997, partial [Pristionchus mayeri]
LLTHFFRFLSVVRYTEVRSYSLIFCAFFGSRKDVLIGFLKYRWKILVNECVESGWNGLKDAQQPFSPRNITDAEAEEIPVFNTEIRSAINFLLQKVHNGIEIHAVRKVDIC